MKGKIWRLMLKVLVVQQLLSSVVPVLCQSAGDFDFFYFVLQWPGAYCDAKQSCCYPKSGKPEANFGIHGLWPNYNDGSWPSNCNPDSIFDKSQISELISKMEKEWASLSCPSNDGVKFWSHEWEKHGTCSKKPSNLKEKANLLKVLKDAGIKPDDGFYCLKSISDAIKQEIGFTPGIQCNIDSQLYLCVDTSASHFIHSPILPNSNCPSHVQFPKF